MSRRGYILAIVVFHGPRRREAAARLWELLAMALRVFALWCAACREVSDAFAAEDGVEVEGGEP